MRTALGDGIGRSATNATKNLTRSFRLRWNAIFSESQLFVGVNAVRRRINQSHGNENQQFLVFTVWPSIHFLPANVYFIKHFSQSNGLAVMQV